jgi:hypothetical protein
MTALLDLTSLWPMFHIIKYCFLEELAVLPFKDFLLKNWDGGAMKLHENMWEKVIVIFVIIPCGCYHA